MSIIIGTDEENAADSHMSGRPTNENLELSDFASNSNLIDSVSEEETNTQKSENEMSDIGNVTPIKFENFVLLIYCLWYFWVTKKLFIHFSEETAVDSYSNLPEEYKHELVSYQFPIKKFP